MSKICEAHHLKCMTKLSVEQPRLHQGCSIWPRNKLDADLDTGSNRGEDGGLEPHGEVQGQGQAGDGG